MAVQEWRRFGILPLVAALGMSATGLHIYGLGAFMGPLQQDFGWGRAQVMAGAALVSFGVALASTPMGMLIDRWGPRRIALLGLPLIGVAVGLLGTATGSMLNWLCLWGLVTVCATFVQAPVWMAAVVSRFEAARGAALAVALCGGSIAIFALPLVATALIGAFGWRVAFMCMGVGWVLILLPFVYLFFRGAQDGLSQLPGAQAGAATERLTGVTLREAVRSADFWKLTAASAFFAISIYGVVVHFVPILTATGISPMGAAVAASFIGIASLVGRLCTGLILDRLPAAWVGAVSFLIPIPGCLLLLLPTEGSWAHLGAAVMFGLSMGAEMDIIMYLAAGRFGLRNFGSIQSAIFAATAFGAASGPLLAGVVFDSLGVYTPYLLGTIVAMALSALMIGTVSRRRPQAADTPSDLLSKEFAR